MQKFASGSISGKLALEAIDGNCEQQLRDTGVDRAANVKMSQEATGLSLSAWSDLRPGNQESQSAFLEPFSNMQRDGGGRLVQLDAVTGKLLTSDSKGRTVEYEAQQDSERVASKAGVGFSSMFLLSPMMMLGMGSALALMEQTESSSQQKEVQRLKQNFEGNNKDGNRAQQPQDQAQNRGKGYLNELTKYACLLDQEKKMSHMSELEKLMGLNPEMTQQQRKFEGLRQLQQNDENRRKKKKKVAMDKTAKLERTRQNVKLAGSLDRTNISTTRLIKSRRRVENLLEHAQEKGSLEEVSRLHSKLEVLDRALTRLATLGL